MKSHYKKIGDYVCQVSNRNTDLKITDLKGININKEFMPSVANINGTDLSKYKIVQKWQFAFNPMHVGRDETLPISLWLEDEPIIVSPAYTVFEIIDHNLLDPKYLMMWCSRGEFDRNCWFTTDSSVRGGFSWDEFKNLRFPLLSISDQKALVKEYEYLNSRGRNLENLNLNLEKQSQAIFERWFIDFDTEYLLKESGKDNELGDSINSLDHTYNEKLNLNIPSDWEVKRLEDLVERVCVGFVGTCADEFCDKDSGVPLLRTTDLSLLGMTYKNLRYVSKTFHSKNKKSQLNKGDVLVARHGSNGMPAIFDRVFEANCLNVIIIKPKGFFSSKLIQLFLKTDLATNQVKTSVGGSVQDVLNTKKLADILVPIPKDISIIQSASKILEEYHELISDIRQEIELIEEFKELLLIKMVA